MTWHCEHGYPEGDECPVVDCPSTAEVAIPPQLPPLFGEAIARQCSRWVGNRNCGKPPVRHVAWTEAPEGLEVGFVCGEHVGELGTSWAYLQAHEPGPHCGMPGSLWFFEANICRCQDEIRAAAPEVELAGATAR